MAESVQDIPKEDVKHDDEAKEDLMDDSQIITIRSGTNGAGESMSFQITRKCLSLSRSISDILKVQDAAFTIEADDVDAKTLGYLVDYLQHHDGNEPDEIPKPVGHKQMKDLVSDPWDAKFIDGLGKMSIFKVILASHKMKINSLLHLACAKRATTIKAMPLQEINEELAKERAYQKAKEEAKRQHVVAEDINDDDSKN